MVTEAVVHHAMAEAMPSPSKQCNDARGADGTHDQNAFHFPYMWIVAQWANLLQPHGVWEMLSTRYVVTGY